MSIPLDPCGVPSFEQNLNIDPVLGNCREPESDCRDQHLKESQKDVSTSDELAWLEEATLSKLGNGQSGLCDPIQAGHIMNEQGGPVPAPNRNVVYRYSKALRGCDEAMMDLFRDIVILDEQGKAHSVPIIWATQEKAVSAILGENWRQDDSGIVEQIPLPVMAMHMNDIAVDPKRYTYHKALDYLRDHRRDWKPGMTRNEGRHEYDTVFGVSRGVPVTLSYTLYAWTMHREDLNQIVESVLLKTMPMAYIRVRGVSWEIGVKLVSTRSNINVDGGDREVPIYKYEFTFSTETYVPQPIVRRKAVLSVQTEIVDAINDDEVSEVISKLEETVKELQ
jgi:hypothetical protein